VDASRFNTPTFKVIGYLIPCSSASWPDNPNQRTSTLEVGSGSEGPGAGLDRAVICRRRMYVHTYGICRVVEKPLSVWAYLKRGFSSKFLRILDIMCHSGVFLPYFNRILDFSTYACILREIQALNGCIRILRRIIRNTLIYITYATATPYNWLNIRVWTQPYPGAAEVGPPPTMRIFRLSCGMMTSQSHYKFQNPPN
jgi:hypothetical protein